MKTVYILHGWAYETNKWDNFVGLLRKKDFKVNLLKIPGLTTKTDKSWTLDEYVEWLRNKTNKEKDRFILLAHSNGGRIALSFSLKHAERLNHLILIDSAGIYHNELPIRTKRAAFKFLAKIGKKLTKSDQLRSLLYKLAGVSDYKNANPHMRQTMVNLLESDKRLQFEKVKVPTTIIWGESDAITPLSDGKVMSRKIPQAKLYVIKSARHSPQFTHPKEVVEIIVKVLNL